MINIILLIKSNILLSKRHKILIVIAFEKCFYLKNLGKGDIKDKISYKINKLKGRED